MDGTKPQVALPRLSRTTAFVWDALTFTLVMAIVILSGDLVRDALVWFADLLAITVYFTALMLTADVTKEGTYIWYLAQKAKNTTIYWRSYWFWKFRYRVSRYVRRIAPRAGRDLFVKKQVRGFAVLRGESIPPEDVPGVDDILRAVRLNSNEMRLLKSEKGASGAMVKDVDALEDDFTDSDTYHEAILRYAARMYLQLDPDDRKLVRSETGFGTWAWLTKDPVVSRILLEVLLPLLAAIAVALLVRSLG